MQEEGSEAREAWHASEAYRRMTPTQRINHPYGTATLPLVRGYSGMAGAKSKGLLRPAPTTPQRPANYLNFRTDAVYEISQDEPMTCGQVHPCPCCTLPFLLLLPASFCSHCTTC